MPGTIEERVAYLEGKVEEHSKAWEDLKDMIIHLDQKVDRRIDALDAKVDRHREELSNRINALDQKFSRYFLWIIGIQVSIFLAIIATLLK
jgi:uncharacterized coiled-coil protein SlyX